MFIFRTRRCAAARRLPLMAFLLGLATGACGAGSSELLVSAASGLDPAMREIARAFESETGVPVRLNFASTGQLAHQIERGAPVDVFVAADGSYLNILDEDGLLLRGSRRTFARGRLALLSPPKGPFVQRLEELADSAVELVAMAHPTHAPYGLAARRALERAGIWAAVESKLVITESVEQSYRYVIGGNVDAALVANSLVSEGDAHVILVDTAFYGMLDHEIAVTHSAPRESAARRFAAFLFNPASQAILRRHGMIPMEEEAE